MFEIILNQIERSCSWNGIQTFFVFLFLAALIFVPLEIFYKAKKHRWLKQEWLTDLLFFVGQFFLFNAISVACLIGIAKGLNSLGLTSFHSTIATQPYWLQLLAVVFLCDFGVYWAHRLSHKIELLWRFHRVHHTAHHLDWMAAYREHPLDNIYTRVVENLPALLLGFPMETIAGFVYFRGLWGLFIHSNVNITMGPLAYVIGSPRLHHWHHDRNNKDGCNFANLSPLMDLLFGTYYDPGKEPEEYGIQEQVNRSYWRQLVDPFVPSHWWKNVSGKSNV